MDPWPLFRADGVDLDIQEVQEWEGQLVVAWKKHGEFARCSSMQGKSCSLCLSAFGDSFYVRMLTDKVNGVMAEYGLQVLRGQLMPDGTIRERQRSVPSRPAPRRRRTF